MILNNRKADILCGRSFTVEHGQFNEFVMVVNAIIQYFLTGKF